MSGRFRHGYPVPGQKLSEADAEVIRSSRGKIPQKDLADFFGVSWAQISRIQNGKRRARRVAFQWPVTNRGSHHIPLALVDT